MTGEFSSGKATHGELMSQAPDVCDQDDIQADHSPKNSRNKCKLLKFKISPMGWDLFLLSLEEEKWNNPQQQTDDFKTLQYVRNKHFETRLSMRDFAIAS